MKRNLATILWKKIFCIFAISVMSCNLMFAQMSQENNTSTLFPLPENLKPNVELWIKVYTLYSNKQVILHDSDDLGIIYEVIDLNEYVDNDQATVKVPWREVEKAKNKYENILNKLASSEEINPELLDQDERAVYNLFKSKASPNVFKQAARNIRAQQGLREEFRNGLIRSGRYAEHIAKVLEKYDIPQELIALPHVESSYNYRAYSKFGAAGIWQFTRSTGRRFLSINYTVDERFDPIKSTEAAAKLLRENYEELGTWPLAINAYNHGVNGLKRAVNQLGTTDIGVIIEKYESRSYKFASRNFYAEFLAALEVRKNHKIYFGDLEFDNPEKFVTFTVPNYVKLSILTDRLGTTEDEIERLNPSLRNSVLSSKRHLPKGFELRVPWRENFDPSVAYANIPTTEKFEQQVATDWYQVESGDNLQKIARRFNTTVTDLMNLNDINNPHQIYVGQVIRLRPEITLAAETNQPANPPIKQEDKPKDELKKETQIGLGDQVPPAPIQPKVSAPIAEMTKKEAITEQPIEESSTTEIPATPIVEKQPAKHLKPYFGKILVQPEETLGHYADWLGIPTQVLRNLNNLRYGQDIQLGQEIKLVFDGVTEKEFERKRMEYHRGIEEDFFASWAIDGVLVHKIKSGENIWYLCNQVYEIPYWLVRKYNPNKNLERLNMGDELIIPVVGQIGNNRKTS
jgi:membrane-bound lytic murein transglycosylase D